ncbi:efflux RND transporter periplasmic adaptor subunit [bacterium]|nr:efflux RND transporter periplasmic adaptor subunit [bacterium]
MKKLVLCLIFFSFLFACNSKKEEQLTTTSQKEIDFWTCSMHPQIKLPEKGLCPICRMDLIPVFKGEDENKNPAVLSLSENAVKLAEIQTTLVEKRLIENEIYLVGKIAFDETRTKTIAARFDGRIEKLYTNFIGAKVRKGEKLAEIYSPLLVSAQEEFLQAIKFADSENKKLLAQKKLELLGISQEQINELEKSKTVRTNLAIHSELDGTVLTKDTNEGSYVETGMPIFTVVDLSKVWVFLEVFETDLPFVKLGQKVDFTVLAYGEEIFSGKIDFVSPNFDAETRTVKIRLEVQNKNEKLKEGMFVRAILKAKISEQKLLAIPKTAVLITGKRAVVYVKIQAGKPTFEGREVVLGSRAGDFYVVKSGLAEGEEVVTNGAFKIDSSLQIKAKKSMMNPEAEPNQKHKH